MKKKSNNFGRSYKRFYIISVLAIIGSGFLANYLFNFSLDHTYFVEKLYAKILETRNAENEEDDSEEEITDSEEVVEEYDPIIESSSAADSNYMLNSLFIGDSKLVNIRNNNQLTDTNALAEESLTCQNIVEDNITDPTTGNATTIEGVITQVNPDNIYLMLGNDELKSFDKSSFLTFYSNIIETIKQVNSDINIIIVPILPVSSEFNMTYLPNQISVATINSSLLDLAKMYKIKYLDITSALASEDGNLLPTFDAGDGANLNEAGIQVFVEYLKSHTVTKSKEKK